MVLSAIVVIPITSDCHGSTNCSWTHVLGCVAIHWYVLRRTTPSTVGGR